MLKSFARAAAFLVYLTITLEMLFMVTPFALYYYSFYSPLLSGPSSLRAIAWLPAFFLPHLSTEILPSLGGVIFLLGLVGFFLSAFQLYYAKFRQRGVVQGGFYKRIRHPQYLFLGLAGLGLLIVWPRFILLLAYINMLYCLSLAGAIGAAFVLRALTFSLTTHLSLSQQRIAAVSFLSINERELRQLVESAEAAEEIQGRIKPLDDWVLIQAMDGKPRVVHVMIDAGMTRMSAKNLPLSRKGIKLVLSRSVDRPAYEAPFSIRARWQPVLVAEMNGQKISRVIELNEGSFLGNPVMPVF